MGRRSGGMTGMTSMTMEVGLVVGVQEGGGHLQALDGLLALLALGVFQGLAQLFRQASRSMPESRSRMVSAPMAPRK